MRVCERIIMDIDKVDAFMLGYMVAMLLVTIALVVTGTI